MSKYLRRIASLLLLCCTVAVSVRAQQGPPKHEFRAAWVATVSNLDWPVRGAPSAAQQDHLVRIFDELSDAGFNAVIFQVRAEGDALYASDFEPWSYWLTGEQGKAPEPFYDPLAFAIDEAHRRGMELHAWFNPYRAERAAGTYPLDASHVVREHPEWIFSIGSPAIRVLDPGLPEVRAYVTGVVMDVVRRYDVDGVHFDDYFYPYPPNQVTNQDDASFAAHHRGITNRADWRRENVNLLIEMVNDSINAVKPHVKFGVSPFGIWRNGVPSGITGLDAYSTIYADARAWLNAQSLDYITPQLYWKFGGGQDYGRLADWWGSVRNGRHLYPGIAAYKANGSEYAGTEVPRQVRFNRASADIHGSVFFRSAFLTDYATKGLADSLRLDVYARPALTPPMEWKGMAVPAAPENLGYRWAEEDTTVVELTWDVPQSDGARRFAVYRVYTDRRPDLHEVVATAEYLVGVTGEATFADRPAAQTAHYFVTSVSANSVESSSESVVTVEGRATSATVERPVATVLHQNFPNPFNPTTSIRYSVDRPGVVSLTVYDALGRRVAVLEDGPVPQGSYDVAFNGTDVAPGTYVYVLESAGGRRARSMVLSK